MEEIIEQQYFCNQEEDRKMDDYDFEDSSFADPDDD